MAFPIGKLYSIMRIEGFGGSGHILLAHYTVIRDYFRLRMWRSYDSYTSFAVFPEPPSSFLQTGTRCICLELLPDREKDPRNSIRTRLLRNFRYRRAITPGFQFFAVHVSLTHIHTTVTGGQHRIALMELNYSATPVRRDVDLKYCPSYSDSILPAGRRDHCLTTHAQSQ
jgi:hypothetical protein